MLYSDIEITSIKEKITKCEESIDRLAPGSEERLAVQQRLVKLEERLNIWEIRRDNFNPESKGML